MNQTRDESNGQPSLLIVQLSVPVRKRMRVVKNQLRILKADFVFLQIAAVLRLIPFKA